MSAPQKMAEAESLFILDPKMILTEGEGDNSGSKPSITVSQLQPYFG